MARYLFECRVCNQPRTVVAAMGQAGQPVCCGIEMSRIYTAPQINTNPIHLRDENAGALRRADRRAHTRQARYDRDYSTPLPAVS